MIGVNIEAGFANRLFKMVSVYAISKKYNIPFTFVNWDKKSHHSNQTYDEIVKRFMELDMYDLNTNTYHLLWNEPVNKFMSYIDINNEVPEIHHKNVLLNGFFQNEKYFKEYRQDIIELLREPECIKKRIELYESNFTYINNSYFIHIRLGDYLTNKKHFVNLNEYYKKCINDIVDKDPEASFVLFSNQVQYINIVYPSIKETLNLHKCNHIILGEQDELVSFYLMKRCNKGGICSNSTFGWWAGWLNTNEQKRIYMPSKWINIDVDNDIYPENCILVQI